MTIFRVKVALAGNGVVGAAAMNWYFSSATIANCNAIKAFLSSCAIYIPSAVTYTIPGSGDTIDEANGKLAGAWSAGADQTQVGTASANWAGQAGAMVKWKASGVVDGHHPIGRGILVPLASSAFGLTGTLNTGAQTAIQGAANSFISASTGFVVWHRPVYDRTVKPPVLTRPGSSLPVTSATVPLVSATLRSRIH